MAEAVVSEYGQGYYHAGEWHAGFTGPAVRPGAKAGKILLGGNGALAAGYLSSPDLWALAAGIPQIGGDLVDGLQWGNDTICGPAGRIEELRVLAARFGFKPGPALLSCGSAGGLHGLNYAKQNPTKVAAIALAIPAVNPKSIRDGNLGGVGASVNAAYGGAAGFDAAEPTHNPMNYAEFFRAFAVLIAFSSNDPICLPQYALEFIERSGATAINVGPQGHGVGSDPAVAQQFIDFYRRYA